MRSLYLFACFLFQAVRLVRAAYSIQQVYAGSTFFDGWSYWGNNDNLTNGESVLSIALGARLTDGFRGNTYYVAKNASQSVAYLNSNGNVILKVDNSSCVLSPPVSHRL